MFLFTNIIYISIPVTCTLTKRTSTSQESRSTARMWHHSSGARGFFRFQKTWDFLGSLFEGNEWCQTKSLGISVVLTFFLFPICFFLFLIVVLTPECLGRWSNLTMSLRWGANLPTWNSWGISKKKVLPNNWCMFFLNRNFGCSKGTSLCWHRDSRWL